MNSSTITLFIIVFVLIVAGMFGYAFLAREEQATGNVPAVDEPLDTGAAGDTVQDDTVSMKQFYTETTPGFGEYVLVGELTVPTPCHVVDSDITILESMPEQVQINLTRVSEVEMCAQVITNRRFQVTFEASSEARLQVFVDGREMKLNLIPPAEGETPATVEFFIKG